MRHPANLSEPKTAEILSNVHQFLLNFRSQNQWKNNLESKLKAEHWKNDAECLQSRILSASSDFGGPARGPKAIKPDLAGERKAQTKEHFNHSKS